MKLSLLLQGLPVISRPEAADPEISGISYASGSVEPGHLFTALKGERRDGMDFLPEALARGAAAVLSDRPRLEAIERPWVRVFDARESLALAAANFYGHPSHEMKIVGVTGTKGKTTTTFILESILRAAGRPAGVIGTIRYRGGTLSQEAARTTPEAPDLQRMLRAMLEEGLTHCVMEVSSHSLALKRVVGISFDVAVFTNLGREHLDYHGSMEEYFEAKKKLFQLNSKKRTAVVNEDDPWGKRLIAELPMTTITFGLAPTALVRGERFRMNGAGLEALVRYPGGQMAIASPLSGRHNLSNILAAFSVALALNVPLPAIREGIAALGLVPGRFERIENDRGFQVFVDYAHTAGSLESLLETARELKPARILLVFGCGGDRDRTKRAPMGDVAGRMADWTILTSDNPRSEDPLEILLEIERGLASTGSKAYSVLPDRREAIAAALSMARPGDCVLIAGKGHETTQTIGDRTIPFIDAEVIREILAGMGAA
jgi:UDP-N-acetylmuramoyl-L-alanyl-D-glutamate--2,6-diaminopimelate ligase